MWVEEFSFIWLRRKLLRSHGSCAVDVFKNKNQHRIRKSVNGWAKVWLKLRQFWDHCVNLVGSFSVFFLSPSLKKSFCFHLLHRIHLTIVACVCKSLFEAFFHSCSAATRTSLLYWVWLCSFVWRHCRKRNNKFRCQMTEKSIKIC